MGHLSNKSLIEWGINDHNTSYKQAEEMVQLQKSIREYSYLENERKGAKRHAKPWDQRPLGWVNTEYNTNFEHGLLTYVIHSENLERFETKRATLLLYRKYPKKRQNRVPWTSANSYINAFIIFIVSVHRTLTKRAFYPFLCKKELDGTFNMYMSEDIQCWTR